MFPVPDGDTGTNMSQTIYSGDQGNATRQAPYSVAMWPPRWRAGALKGARGNSGVILSQILRGFASALDGRGGHRLRRCWSSALRAGADTAYKAVMKPKEGTILTVARVMAEEAERKAAAQVDGRRGTVQA